MTSGREADRPPLKEKLSLGHPKRVANLRVWLSGRARTRIEAPLETRNQPEPGVRLHRFKPDLGTGCRFHAQPKGKRALPHFRPIQV